MVSNLQENEVNLFSLFITDIVQVRVYENCYVKSSV